MKTSHLAHKLLSILPHVRRKRRKIAQLRTTDAKLRAERLRHKKLQHFRKLSPAPVTASKPTLSAQKPIAAPAKPVMPARAQSPNSYMRRALTLQSRPLRGRYIQ